jgi:hypothetical protein
MATATGGSGRATGRAGRATTVSKRSDVLRPGSAARPVAPTPAADGLPDEGLVTPNGAPRPAGGAVKRPATTSSARRPPPRPRKGKGKGKGGKRR